MPKIIQSDYETQALAYLRRIVDALEHISLTLLNIASIQTQHPSVGAKPTGASPQDNPRTDPLTIEAPKPTTHNQLVPTQDIPSEK